MGGIIKTFKSPCLCQSWRNPPRLFKENCDPLTQHNVWMKVRVILRRMWGYLSSAPLAITQVVTRTHWAGKSGIKSGAAEPNFITMAMVEKRLLLLHIFLSAPSIGSGSFSANHDTFADNDSIVEGDVEMTALTVNTGGLCVDITHWRSRSTPSHNAKCHVAECAQWQWPSTMYRLNSVKNTNFGLDNNKLILMHWKIVFWVNDHFCIKWTFFKNAVFCPKNAFYWKKWQLDLRWSTLERQCQGTFFQGVFCYLYLEGFYWASLGTW